MRRLKEHASILKYEREKKRDQKRMEKEAKNITSPQKKLLQNYDQKVPVENLSSEQKWRICENIRTELKRFKKAPEEYTYQEHLFSTGI